MVVARDIGLSSEAEGEERLVQLVVAAAVDSITSVSSCAEGRRFPLMLFFALPEAGRPYSLWRSERLVEAVEEALMERAQVLGRRVATLGHVAGNAALHAIKQARDDGFDGYCLLLGVDSWLDPICLEWLDEAGLLHSSTHPFGFVPGEAAAGLLIGPQGLLNVHSSKAYLDSSSLTVETDLAIENPRLGLALTKAAREVLHLHNSYGRVVDTVITDLNGVPERADEVGYTLVRLNEFLLPGYRMITPAEWFGDIGAATIPLMVALVVVAAEKGYGKGGTSMLLSQSVGAERGAITIFLCDEKYKE